MMDFSKRVRGLRSRLSLSQQEFADRLGASQATVSRWEKGLQVPSQEAIASMLRLGSFDEADLIDDAKLTFTQSSWGDEVEVVGSIESNRLTTSIEWPEERRFKINIPLVNAWSNLSIKGFIVNDNVSQRFYPKGSVVLVTPYKIKKLEPQDGDKVVFAEANHRQRFEIFIGEVTLRDKVHIIQSTGMRVETDPLDRSNINRLGGYGAIGFVGLIIGGFTLEDPSRLAVPIEAT